MRHTMRRLCAGGDLTLGEWNTSTDSPETIAHYAETFDLQVEQGLLPFDITRPGEERPLRAFDPNADILFIPKFSGGACA